MPRPSIVLDVPLMDDDHARLEEVLAGARSAPDAQLPELLKACEAETRAHFAREEALMWQENVPILHCHIAQHNIVLAAFGEGHKLAAAEAYDALRRFLTVDIGGAIQAHIDSVDRVTASFLKHEVDRETLKRPAPALR